MSSRFLGQFLKFLGGNVFLTTANLIRDASIAATFGRTQETDHFFLAVTFLIFLVTVFGNACRSVYVPTLQTALQQTPAQFEGIARRLSVNNIQTLTAISAAMSISAGLLAITSKQFLNTQIESRALAILELIPMYALSAFIEGSQGPLQTKGKIFLPGLMRLGLPLGIIIGVIFGGKTLGIHVIAIGGLIGSLLSASTISVMLHKSQMLALNAPKLPINIAKNVRNGILALIASSCIAYITPVVDIWMASILGAGAASTLGYASRLAVGIASLLVGSLAPVFLHRFSQQVASNNLNALNISYSNYIAIAPWIGSAATIGTFLFSGVVTSTLYQHGQFTSKDTQQVSELINVYALQYPFFLTCTAGFTLISALSKNQAFIRLNLILLITDVVANILFMQIFGIKGIALSTVTVYAISLLSMNLYLTKNALITLSRKDIQSGTIAILLLTGSLLLLEKLGLHINKKTSSSEYQSIIAILAIFFGAAYFFCKDRLYFLRPPIRNNLTDS